MLVFSKQALIYQIYADCGKWITAYLKMYLFKT